MKLWHSKMGRKRELGAHLAKTEVTGEGRGLGCDPLLETTVSADDVSEVVYRRVFIGVEGRRQVLLSHCHANGVGEPLSEGAGTNLNPRGAEILGVSRSL